MAVAKPTKGSEAFRLRCEALGQLAVAAALTRRLNDPARVVYQGNVTGWASGKHTPSLDVLVAISREFPEIAIPDWTRPLRRALKRAG